MRNVIATYPSRPCRVRSALRIIGMGEPMTHAFRHTVTPGPYAGGGQVRRCHHMTQRFRQTVKLTASPSVTTWQMPVATKRVDAWVNAHGCLQLITTRAHGCTALRALLSYIEKWEQYSDSAAQAHARAHLRCAAAQTPTCRGNRRVTLEDCRPRARSLSDSQGP
eukprot:UN2424